MHGTKHCISFCANLDEIKCPGYQIIRCLFLKVETIFSFIALEKVAKKKEWRKCKIQNFSSAFLQMVSGSNFVALSRKSFFLHSEEVPKDALLFLTLEYFNQSFQE